MILIDANILLYAYKEQSMHHKAAVQWLGTTLSSDVDVGLPFQSFLAFIRISTNPKLPQPIRSNARALEVVDTWLEQPKVSILTPRVSHWSIFKRLCLASAVTGNLSTDAHLAALSIEHDGMLYTTDKDFARFAGLRWQNPLL